MGNELFNIAPFLHHHDCIRNSVVRSERAFNFAQLNSEAANFYLMVRTAKKFQIAVRHPSDQIARPVKPLSSFRRERIGNELFCRKSRAVRVATGYSRAANV
jgi:hypothetical protein